jgi:membrane-associated phospholipid phosphatase
MGFELEIVKWFQGFRNSFLDVFFELFTMFGEELLVIAVLGGIYWTISKKKGELLGITVFISLGVNSFIKMIFMRPRPFMVDDTITNLRPETSGGYSFPSGHTQSASTLFFGVYQFFKNRVLLVLAIVITVMVALSRVYIGVHYPTDVIVGALLGFIITYYGFLWLTKMKNLDKFYNKLLIIANTLLIVMLVYNLFAVNNGTFDSQLFYFNTEALAKMIGVLVGFVIGVKIEKKYVNFDNHKILYKNLIRFVLGVVAVLIVRILLKEVFHLIVDPENLIDNQPFLSFLATIFDYLRYGIMVIVGIGIYPIVFKKLNI